MNTDSLVIVATVLIGYIGIFVMLSQVNARFDTVNARIDNLNTSLNTKIDTSISELRSEIKSDFNTLELKMNTLLLGLFRDYYRPIYPPPKEDEAA